METLKALETSVLGFISRVNGFLWGDFAVYFLIGAGVLYTLLLFFPQYRYFRRMFASLRESLEGQGITGFRALAAAVGSQIGTGNLAGVASAIVMGGPGAIFWMWMTAVLGMATIIGETVLAQIYRRKDETTGTYIAGPAFYIERGTGQRWLSILFAASAVAGLGIATSMVHSNAVAGGLSLAFGVNKVLFGLVIMVCTEIVLFGGLKRVTRVASAIVPIMALVYVVVGLVVFVMHLSEIPAMFALIFKHAFGVRAVAGGIAGHTVRQAIRYGCARGLFSNEAGWGSTPHFHGAAEVKHPMNQAMTAMFGVFLDTILVCTVTASVILLSGQAESGLNGLELTQMSFASLLGANSSYGLAIIAVLFAWTSLVAGLFYGEANIRYLFSNNHLAVNLFRLLTGALVFIGALTSVPLVWECADFFNAFTMISNIVCILVMSKLVIKIMKDYDTQYAKGNKHPVFDRNSIDIPERSKRKITQL
jgi:AGCS family alanine or glycine:cation symporter